MSHNQQSAARRSVRRSTTMVDYSWAWQEQAACRGLSSNLFFGPDGEKPPQRDQREKRALQVCAACPVREACQHHALGVPEPYGVWGGTTESGRAAVRRRRLASPAA